MWIWGRVPSERRGLVPARVDGDDGQSSMFLSIGYEGGDKPRPYEVTYRGRDKPHHEVTYRGRDKPHHEVTYRGPAETTSSVNSNCAKFFLKRSAS